LATGLTDVQARDITVVLIGVVGGNTFIFPKSLLHVLAFLDHKLKTQLGHVQLLLVVPLNNTMMELIRARIALVGVLIVRTHQQLVHYATKEPHITAVQILARVPWVLTVCHQLKIANPVLLIAWSALRKLVFARHA
jgi:hypothetical protein